MNQRSSAISQSFADPHPGVRDREVPQSSRDVTEIIKAREGISDKTIIIVGGSFAGIKAAWDLRHLLDDKHRILLLSDKPRTTFRASFPRVFFENLDLEKITMNLAENFKDTGLEFICDPLA